VCDFFPADPNHHSGTSLDNYNRITIEHLLTMTSGIDFDNSAHYPIMLTTDNWCEYVLSRPVINSPGTHWKYKADPTVLSGIVTQVTGMSMLDYAQQHMFSHIGIDEITWVSDPAGNSSGNGDVHTTARHYARFGYLFLNYGRWDNRQILSPMWIWLSTQPCRSSERLFCNCWDSTGVPVSSTIPLEYGFLWWCRKMDGVPEDAYYAFGGYGQFVVVIPSLDLVIVRLGHKSGQSDIHFLPEMTRRVVEAVITP
jgi:CubicO group peptidase (beta-lactamase class C family)